MSGFSVSMWPGVAVPVPGVPRAPLRVVVEETTGEQYLFSERWVDYETGDIHVLDERFAIPDELYLRQLDALDISDPSAVVAFLNSYGVLAEHGVEDSPFLPNIWADTPAVKKLTTDLMEQRARFVKSEARRLGVDSGGLVDALQVSCIPIAEARFYLSLVRDMARAWRFLSGQASDIKVLLDTWETAAIRPDSTSTHESSLRVQNFFLHYLSPALRPFHVRPQIPIDRGGRRPAYIYDPVRDYADLYNVLMLQIANHISENATYRICQKCGTTFVRQQGRAKYGEHRTTGKIVYCSKLCAHAAAQKAHYDRTQAAKRERTP